ncbi:hypothetical protein [Rhizobium etli]|uniref:HEPN domain-containing protein n=1 Tax=Rhizobium etli TaxID=29449 RepID=A0A7W6VG40_RHIET|nr:hypothetical protein [Rhizobium etli]MBB4483516.1 hypothetical protein [Rhizobium etli]MBB4539340.1 hypothetical protein [Rhizobium etli]
MRYPADIFTEEAMTRPLFEPFSAEHERPDEWSGPHGFVIGGTATYAMQAERDGALAEQYFEAANALVDAILDKQVADYQVANAALFLYRHCFELLLKAGLPSKVREGKNIHHLGNLVKSYAHHKQQEGHVVPAWVITRCEELGVIDPGSLAFRYGDYGTPTAEDGSPIFDEIHVDLHHLKTAMRALNTTLVDQNWSIRMARGDLP